jgi:hypothetical protein
MQNVSERRWWWHARHAVADQGQGTAWASRRWDAIAELWLRGVPLPIILLTALFWHH